MFASSNELTVQQMIDASDILKDIAKADYLVQLSDCEAFCYSVVEALTVGTPVIVTDLPVFKELGINNDNAIICDMKMKNISIDKIKQKHEFSYTPPKSEWNKYLDNNTTYDPNDTIEVIPKRNFTDIELGKPLQRNIPVKMRKARVSELECKGLVERCD